MDDEEILNKVKSFRGTSIAELTAFLEKLDIQKLAVGPTSDKMNTVTLKDVLGASGNVPPAEAFSEHLTSDIAKQNLETSQIHFKRYYSDELDDEGAETLYQALRDKAYPEMVKACAEYFKSIEDA